MVFLTTVRISSMPLRALRAPPRAVRISRPIAAFHTSPLRAALSESDRVSDHPEAGEKAAQSKEDSLKAQKEGKGHHKDELASNSESALKHDKHNMSFEEMQKQGSDKANAEK